MRDCELVSANANGRLARSFRVPSATLDFPSRSGGDRQRELCYWAAVFRMEACTHVFASKVAWSCRVYGGRFAVRSVANGTASFCEVSTIGGVDFGRRGVSYNIRSS